MTKFTTFRLLASLFVALVFSPPLLCAPARAAKGATSPGQVSDIGPKIDNKAPIHITSDRMEANQQGGTIVFEGHVHVQQSDLTITSKRLEVTLAKANQSTKAKPKQVAGNTSDPSQKIDYIEFRGDVTVTQQDRVATAQEAIFFQKEHKILLKGSPVVTKGQDKIQGKLITIYLNDNRCVVEGGGGAQVRAVLFPEKKE
ncbi:MAG: LptA/OstA family protein [Syntrophobacteraceae bacterium]|nr:LptA/OstA family protein [Syntrophobacteraceae bacterium]